MAMTSVNPVGPKRKKSGLEALATAMDIGLTGANLAKSISDITEMAPVKGGKLGLYQRRRGD